MAGCELPVDVVAEELSFGAFKDAMGDNLSAKSAKGQKLNLFKGLSGWALVSSPMTESPILQYY